MKQLILLFSVLFSLQVMSQVNVTFRVNMQNVSGFTTPEVNGTFNNWCGNCTPMTDANGDNIWEVTIPLTANSYEYKFSADNWGSQENLAPGSSCTVTNFGFTNRSLTVSTTDIILPVVCWGSCDNCSSVFPVTFQVDMTQQTGFTTPEVNGSFNGWCGSCNPMTDANGDGIWQTTLYLSPGNYEYKFSADGWGSQENLTPGSSCTTTNFGYTNRTLTVGNSAVTQPVVCWGSCVACNQVLPSYNVTFRVDMSQQTGFTTPEVNGTFNNWCGASCNPMTDANSDNIWETTIALQAGSYEYKFAVDNWTSSEQLTDGSSCTVTNGGFVNRSLTVSGNTTLDIVCYGTCSACIVAVPGCTNFTAANYNPAATVDNGSCLYNTTFNVDMACAGVSFTNVYVTGPWCGWCGAESYNLLTDANGDGIYSGTVQLAAGNIEYKYMVDGWASQENLVDDMQNGGTCAPVTDYANYANRQGAIGSTFNDVYGRCSACPTALYNVTFQVDMSQQTGFTTPALNGNFNGWCGPCNPMTDVNGDGIWEITLQLAAGSYEYKFTADGWSMQENLTPGASCTVTNFGYTNRFLTVTNSDITQPVVCWGSCSSCSAPSYNVTFQVDMSQQTGFTTPELNGSFNGWCGNCNPMTDANGDGVWEITIPLQAGSYEYKFSADFWTTQESLQEGSSCTVTNFGYTNRTVVVSNSNITQPVVCWGSCSACAPIVVPGCTDSNAANYNPAATTSNGSCVYNHTFSVDMTCAGVNYTNVYVTGPWCGWCGADTYNLLTDGNGDGIYSTTVQLAAGNVEYKYMVDNWASQENLIDDMQNGGTCAPVTDYWAYANRLVVVGSVNSDVYGRCSACEVAIPGCTDSNAVNYNSSATTDNGTCLYATTFNVDMSCAGSFTNVYVTGPWCGWCGADVYNVMTDANADGIYSVTVNLAGTIEYKYMVDNWASQENLVDDMQNGGTCAPVTDYWSYANRTTAGGSTTNDVYGRCSACPILGCMNAIACNYDASATQDDGSCVLPALTYYIDTDNDGYGAGTSTLYCANPGVGYSSNNTDCNDAVASVNPGASEVCGNNFDDNCNGTVNEGCSVVPADEPSNATSIAQSQWPNCSSVSGTLVGATASSTAQTICLTGEDKWHQFVATSEAISIQVNSSAFDAVIELQSASGTLVASENAVSGIGSEILNIGGLTAGQVYKVGVRNYNSANGNGTYTICVKKLKRGGCDYGPGPYTLCQYFKASWAGGTGAQYRFTFTGLSGAASGNVYTKTQSTDICVLSTVTPTLPYGSSYNVLITTIYSLVDGAGNVETIEVPALSPCSLNTSPEAASQLRSTDNCTAGPRFRSAVVASLPWSCGAVNWRWEFVEVDGSNNPVGLPIYHLRGTASNYLNLGTVAALQYGKTYAVRTAPIFTYTGTNYNWGPVQYMCIVGQSGMITEGANAQGGDDVKDAQDLSENLNVYPNPTNGSDINIQLSNITSDNVQVRVLDAMGRVVFANRYAVDGMFTTNMTFDRPLANGLYLIEASFNGEVLTQRMMVQK